MSSLLLYAFLSILILCYLYVASRMITRGVLRSIRESKKESENGSKAQ